jgi:uncharacterized protein (DUF2132 family)
MEELVAQFRWEDLGKKIKINCFIQNPSVIQALLFYAKHLGLEKKLKNIMYGCFLSVMVREKTVLLAKLYKKSILKKNSQLCGLLA